MRLIESGDTYDHSIHGKVRVSCILDKYTAYDPDGQVGHESETLVRFSNRWDDYGLLPPHRNEPIDEFVSNTEPVE